MTKTEPTTGTSATGLYCGAARGVITPSVELLPDLCALRDEVLGGILDDIYVRVIAVGDGQSKALVIGFELDKVPYPAENLALLSERTGIPEENILYFSTHNHTSPVMGDRPEEGPNDISRKPPRVQEATHRYERQVLEVLLRTVDEALANMRPARMGCARGESHIAVNRNQTYEYVGEDGEMHSECGLGADPTTPTDDTLFVLKFEDLDGAAIAFFMNYAVHCCVMISYPCCDGKAGVSGDLSGAVCGLLEERFAGSVAVWSSGAAGDVNPVMLNEMYHPDPETGRPAVCLLGEGALAALQILAGRHYADVLKVERTIACQVDSAPIDGRVSWSFTPGRDTVVREDGSTEAVTGEGVDPYEIRVHLVRMGEVALFGFSGELYSSLGMHLKQISPLENTVLVNHEASLMARSHYIFDDRTLTREMASILPGRRNTHMQPGYVLQSLEEHMLRMLAESGSRR